MAVTFNELISQNKRNSFLLAIIVSLVVILLGGLIGYFIGVYDMDADWRSATLTGMAIAFGITIFMLVFSYFGGAGTVLAISQAKPIEKKDDPQLFNVVEEMAIAGGVPMPKIYLIDDPAPNAFATGRNPEHGVVAITTGLRQKLNRDELQAVMAHELSHIRNYDILFSMLMAVLAGVIVLLADFFLRYLFYGALFRRRGGGRTTSSRGNQGGGLIMLLMLVIAIVLSILAPLIAKIIQLAVSRQREYLADASGVDLTRNPDGLASALAKISGDKEVLQVANRATQHLYIVNPLKPTEQRSAFLFSTHPPIKERISRILSLK